MGKFCGKLIATKIQHENPMEFGLISETQIQPIQIYQKLRNLAKLPCIRHRMRGKFIETRRVKRRKKMKIKPKKKVKTNPPPKLSLKLEKYKYNWYYTV